MYDLASTYSCVIIVQISQTEKHGEPNILKPGNLKKIIFKYTFVFNNLIFEYNYLKKK